MKDRDEYRLSSIFPKVMFWDVDMDTLSIVYDDDFIIQRVLSRTVRDINDLHKLENLYSINKIKYYALNSNEIRGNELISFIAEHYDLNPIDFRNWLKLP
jgi:hypothetical protein